MRKADRPVSATNGRHESPSNATNHSGTPSLNGVDAFRSNTSSPLFDAQPLPEDDHAHCPYCHKDFRKPRVLDCLHSMCEDCIIAQLDGRLQQKSATTDEIRNPKSHLDCELEAPKETERPTPPGVIRCPVCAQESHVGNDVRYVHAMLPDYVRLAELDEAPSNAGNRSCKACKSEQPAVAMCKQCNSDLCSNCVTAHSVMKLFDGHKVTTYGEMKERGAHPEMRPVMCTTHTHHTRYLCAVCETTACKQCLDVDHLNHKIIDVTDLVVKAIQEDVTVNVDKLEKKYNTTMNEVNCLPSGGQLMEQHENARFKLESYFEELENALKDMKLRKLLELDEARVRQENNLEEIFKKMRMNEGKVNDAIMFTRRLLKKANGMELVVSRRKVIQQLGNLSHAIPSNGNQTELEFQPLSKKQVEHHINALAGNVIGRLSQPNVKDIAPIGTEVANRLNSNQQVQSQEDWGRGMYGTSVAPQNLGAIGGERKKQLNGGLSNGNVTEFGWPPSSNPPEPGTPPPVQQPIPLMNTNAVGAVNSQLLPSVTASAAAAAGLRPDLLALASANIDLTSLGNGVNVPVSLSTPGAAANLFPLWSQPSMNGINGSTSSNTALASNQAAILQQKLALIEKANLQQLLFPNQRNLIGSQILGMNSLRNPSSLGQPSFEQLLAMSTLSLNPQNAAAAQALTSSSAETGVSSQTGTGIAQRVSDLKVHSVFGTSQQGSSIRELHCPSGFCLSETDDILIADTNNHRVVVCGPPHPWKIGRPGTDDGQLCFPRKVIALKGDSARYVVLDKGGDGKTRAQIFEARGEFVKRINMVALVPRGGIEVSAAAATPTGQLLLVDSAGLVYSIDVDAPRVTSWFDASTHLGEASDVAMYENNIYITDFKHHCVQVFTSDGKFIRKMGEPSQTPYPIGIDVSKSGEILVADTHGNHLHVVVFGADGLHQHSFTHNEFRLSRCVGLRIAKSGHIVTLCKHNHTLFVFKPLVLPNGVPVPTPVAPNQPSLINKF